MPQSSINIEAGKNVANALEVGRSKETAWMISTWVAIVIAACVRFHNLDFGLWVDEVASVEFASHPLTQLWSNWMVRESNPPLYYSLLRFWIEVFGSSDFSVKSLSAFLGSIGVGLAAFIARWLSGRWINAFFVACLLAVAAPHVASSQQARAYILSATIATCGLMAVLRIVQTYEAQGRTNWPAWACLGAGFLLALYSHTTMVVFYGATSSALLAWIATSRTRRALLPWVLTNTAVLLCYFWWILVTLRQVQESSNTSWMRPLGLRDAVGVSREAFLPGTYGLLSWLSAAIYLFLIAHLLLASQRSIYRLIIFYIGICLALFYVLSAIQPIMTVRTVLWLLPVLTLALSSALVSLSNPVLRWSLLVFLCGTWGWQTYRDAGHREVEDWNGAAAYLLAQPREPVFVAHEGLALALRMYCERRLVSDCPLQVFIIDNPMNSGWSRGLSGYRTIPVAAARTIAACQTVHMLNWNAESSSRLLDQREEGSSVQRRTKAFGWIEIQTGPISTCVMRGQGLT